MLQTPTTLIGYYGRGSQYLWQFLLSSKFHSSRQLYLQKENYNLYFRILGIPVDSDEVTTRNAFIKLAKVYHPDSGQSKADPDKFQEVESAYRKILEKFSKERRNNDCEGEFGLYYDSKRKQETETEPEEEIKDFDIKHTAPQHRQYLTYGDIGSGSPYERAKQHRQHRARKAAEATLNYQVEQFEKTQQEPGLLPQEKRQARKIKTRSFIDRLVEDLIQESMSKGDFENLSNAGKPLKFQNHNPYLDSVTHKLNQVLIDNGYAPEWVLLEKEIRLEKERLKNILRQQRMSLGSVPLTREDERRWKETLPKIQNNVKDLNKIIDHYNLVVPMMSKQMVHYPIDRIAKRILEEGASKENCAKESNIICEEPLSSREKFGVKTLISFFKKR